jgi:hypothetical protein
MQHPAIITRRPLTRRHFLRGAGAAAVSLPLLDAMLPSLGQRALGMATPDASAESPKRFVAMCATLGFHTPFLFPEKEGKDFELTPYLQKLADHRDSLSLFSGLSHPNQQGNNGHASELTWLTSAQRPGLAGFKNTISLDQLIAEKIGVETRYPYLALSTHGGSLSWTSNGVEIPSESSPQRLFKQLFIDGTEEEVAAQMRGLKRGRSILDTVRGQARQLGGELGTADRQKLAEYLAAVRDLESRLQQSEGWTQKPKPKVDADLPTDIENTNDAIGRQRMMYDVIALALQTDSSRTVTFRLSGLNSVPVIDDVQNDWHNLSHHGKDEAKIKELKIIEEAQFIALNEFLTKLKRMDENGETLLDHTAVLFGSNLGNASSHSARNLPILLAGGGYRHGSYVAHDEQDNTPLSNLFVSLAQRMGVETREFGSSTAESIRGLDS